MGAAKLKTLKPAEGRTVPLEDGMPWPTETIKLKGKDVETSKAIEVSMTRYFRRRLRDGDLIDVNAESETSKQDEVETEINGVESASKTSAANSGKKGK